MASDVLADIACIAREAGPNQPRYAFTSRSLGARRGRVKCSELPTDMPALSFEHTRKLRTRLAPRSVCTRPSRNAKPGRPTAPTVEAFVPPLIDAPPPVMK